MAKLNVRQAKLKGILIIEPPSVFEDFRGIFVETYNEQLYKEAGITVKFLQDDISISYKNVLRGIHGDMKTWKLASCLFGELYVVIVNCDRGSKDFGQWESFALSDLNRIQLLIPPKYGTAHLVISEKAIFNYKQSTYYDRSGQFTYKWDDPAFNINWPVKNPILSERDKKINNL